MFLIWPQDPGLRNDRVTDYAGVCRSKRDCTPLGFNHFMRWPLRAATVCTLSSFGSSSVWQMALTQTFQRLWTRPKDARCCAIKPRKALREIETRGPQRFGSGRCKSDIRFEPIAGPSAKAVMWRLSVDERWRGP